jgi:hypothetical protein
MAWPSARIGFGDRIDILGLNALPLPTIWLTFVVFAAVRLCIVIPRIGPAVFAFFRVTAAPVIFGFLIKKITNSSFKTNRTDIVGPRNEIDRTSPSHRINGKIIAY